MPPASAPPPPAPPAAAANRASEPATRLTRQVERLQPADGTVALLRAIARSQAVVLRGDAVRQAPSPPLFLALGPRAMC